MAREHGRVLSRIWRDPDFRALSVGAQRMYLLLLSQPTINNAGMLPLQIGKFAKGCDSTSEEDVRIALGELARANFAYFDEDSEEVFVRSYIRNDGVLKQPNIVKNALRCAAAIESEYLRSAMAIELRRIGRDDATARAAELDPSETAADDFQKAHARVLEGLVTPFETLPEPFPETEGFRNPSPNPAGRGRGRGESPVGSSSSSQAKEARREKAAPAKPDAAKPKAVEQVVAERAYERVGKALNFMATRQIVKWAIHERGADPDTVENAIVSIYKMGKPITRQVVGQFLDGHFHANTNGISRADQKVQGYLEMGARLTSHSDEPKEITR
ncbi:hypothetical protein LTT66_18120 [Nocardia gipuzkoensis]|uniref:hypothetical protein n=1 Tax=Nocardia gipuzkoensis TaxID=2749991 RepID=UPI001E28644D|nr:hypothetical protein [Nocardia gipuzkoensis]UGT65286.1 hypothetical protein LTT66_18120 [Nocardia gipuzkoensis]